MSESTELKAVLLAGEKLSNIAFNLRQLPGESLSDTFASALRDAFGEWDTAIAAYRRASLAEGKAEPAWLPIETAPKDGRRVLLTIGGYTGPRGPFSHPDSDAEIMHMARWTGEFWEPYIPNEWTHWKPLPSPPSMDGAVQAATSGGER